MRQRWFIVGLVWGAAAVVLVGSFGEIAAQPKLGEAAGKPKKVLFAWRKRRFPSY